MLSPGQGNPPPLSHAVQDEISELLINAGGLANLPKRDRIELRRASSSSLVISKDPPGRNQFSLLESIAIQYGLLYFNTSGEWQTREDIRSNLFNKNLSFPDFKKVVIYRRTEKSTKQTAINVDVEDILNSGDCSRDIWLQWGDVVEIPEADHPVDVKWDGLSETNADSLIKCVARQVTIKIKGESTTLKLTPALVDTRSMGWNALHVWRVTIPSFMLRSVLDNSKLIRVSSDLSRVKVTRTDPATKNTLAWTIDCSDNKQSTLWLRDGDVVEVPEK
jgi:hypothetical protein